MFMIGLSFFIRIASAILIDNISLHENYMEKFLIYCRNFCTKMYLVGADTQKYLYIPKYVSYCTFYLIAVSKNSKYNKSYEKVYRTP